MARAITDPGELVKLRAAGPFSLLHLIVDAPVAVFAARINQTFTTLNNVTQITYDTVTVGAFADVVIGMTLYIGTSAGAHDIGMTRIRKAATATELYINPESELKLAEDQYLTVVDEYGLWCKRLNDDDGKVDFDVTYTNQHTVFDPVPVLGPDVVLRLTGATVDYTPTAAASYCLSAGAITYLWAAPGASATAGLNTATPTITYNAAGRYLVSCTVTCAAKTTTGRRNVYIEDGTLATDDFIMTSLRGSHQQGGWSMRVTLYDNATLALVRERAKVILYARDFYNGVEESLGPVAGAENVIFIGWIAEESIVYNPRLGIVEFDVEGSAGWLKRLESQPIGLEDSQFADGSATGWAEFADLTIDKGLWHVLHERSTATTVIDCILTSDTRQAPFLSCTHNGLLEQLDDIAGQIYAKALCDRYGRLFVEIDPQMVALADRAGFPSVMTITEADWIEQIDIYRTDATESAVVEIVGHLFDDGDEADFGGRSPGDAYGDYGGYSQQDDKLVGSRDQCLQMAGLLGGWENNEYPETSIEFAMNNRFFDICPRQYGVISVVAADTPRAIVWTNKKLIPRRIEYEHNETTGFFHPTIEFEGETFEQNSVEFEIPSETEPPIIPPEEPPAPPLPPELPPIPPTPSETDAVVATSGDVNTSADFDQVAPVWASEVPSATAILDADLSEWGDDCYFVIEEGSVWRTTDLTAAGAATWEEVWTEADFEDGVLGSLVRVRCSTVDGLLYVLGWGTIDKDNMPFVLRSTNRGLSWVQNWIDEGLGAKPYTVTHETGGWTDPGTVTHTHTRVGDNGGFNPWAMAWSTHTDDGTNPQYGITGNGDTIHDFSSTGLVKDIIYGHENDLMGAGDQTTAREWLDDYFGAGGWSLNAGLNQDMPMDVARVKVVLDSAWGASNPVWTADSWVFWNLASVTMPKAFDVARTNENWLYLSVNGKIIQSQDGGYTWADWYTDGAYDLIVDPQIAGAVYAWNTDGELILVVAGVLNAVLDTESPWDQHLRIARQLNGGILWYLCGDGDLRQRQNATNSDLVTGIIGARCLKTFLGGTGARLVYLDSTSVQYSDDAGATFSDKTGTFAGYADPVTVHLIE